MINNKISIGHFWCEYSQGLFHHPHSYFVNKEDWVSNLYCSQLLAQNQFETAKNINYLKFNNVNNLYLENFSQKIIRKIKEPFFWKKYNLWVYQNILKKNIDIVHIHFGHTGVRLLPTLKKIDLPIVISFYGVDASRLLYAKGWHNKFKKLFKRASVIIVLCEEVKKRIIAMGFPEKRIVVWNIPIELETYKYLPRTTSAITKFIICARFVEKKGYKYLIEAFNMLVKKNNKVFLTIIGYGDKKKMIQQDIIKYNLTEFVNLIDTNLKSGFPHLYYENLLKNDIFILPSVTAINGDDEGGPALTLIAAQAAGLPVICTPFPGAEISVIDNVTGIICKSNDSQNLFSKMEYLMNNPDLWNKLGKNGHQVVLNEFNFEKQMQKIAKIYIDLVV